MSLKKQLSKHLQTILSFDNIVIEIPQDKNMGDFSTPIAFSLAKILKKSPIIIANEICDKLSTSDFFDKVTVVKGFVNLSINMDILNKNANDFLTNGLVPYKKNNEKILLEFVSANPTGPLHIGHARGAIVGEALSSIGNFLGYEIDKEYYVNDIGMQIKLLGTSMQIAYREKENITTEHPPEYYKGEHIDNGVLEIQKENGNEIFDDDNFDKLCSVSKDKMLSCIIEDLDSLDIKFDFFVSESDMYKKADSIIKILEKNESVYTKDGKVWLASSKLSDEKDRVVLKEDKTPTYLAGDITYHHNKFNRDYDKYINIWGADHHGYIDRVKASINFLGFDENKLEIILSQMVSLLKEGKPYKMSKRKGTFIMLKEVIDIVGQDALKLIFLSKKCDTHLEFDIDTLTQQNSSNIVYYIHYAHTRIFSLLEKTSFDKSAIANHQIVDNINKEAKWLLVSSLMLEDVLENAFLQREVNKLVDYVYQLSSSVHSFYNQNKIIGNENELDFLKILSIAGVSIKASLSIIGIQAKESM